MTVQNPRGSCAVVGTVTPLVFPLVLSRSSRKSHNQVDWFPWGVSGCSPYFFPSPKGFWDRHQTMSRSRRLPEHLGGWLRPRLRSSHCWSHLRARRQDGEDPRRSDSLRFERHSNRWTKEEPATMLMSAWDCALLPRSTTVNVPITIRSAANCEAEKLKTTPSPCWRLNPPSASSGGRPGARRLLGRVCNWLQWRRKGQMFARRLSALKGCGSVFGGRTVTD